jgi:hypothetical protein
MRVRHNGNIRVFGIATAASLSTFLLVSTSRADVPVTFTNFDANSHQVLPLDVQGNVIDAHFGDIEKLGNMYYLYGESYTCGWLYNSSSRAPCGMHIYSSPDLIHWSYRGAPFDVVGSSYWATQCAGGTAVAGCWAPHVLYNPMNSNYVLWVLTGGKFQVLTASRPEGPFVLLHEGTVANFGTTDEGGYGVGDFDLFQDGGNAYIVYDKLFGPGRAYNIFVERLDTSFTSGTGQFVDTGAQGEGVAAFVRNGTTYVLYGAAGCAFCGGTPTKFVKAAAPLGTYSSTPIQLSSDSCGGQPHDVTVVPTPSGPAYVFQSDLWMQTPVPNQILPNQAQAGTFRTQLAFDANGDIQPFTCPATTSFTLSGASAGSDVPADGLDQASGNAGFTLWGSCQLHNGTGGYQYLQTFTPSVSGAVRSVAVGLFKSGPAAATVPDAGVTISVVALAGGVPSATLYSATVPESDVLWAPTKVAIVPTSLSLAAGTTYGIVIGSNSNASNGCYGFLYDDANPYSGGSVSYEAVGGTVWTAQTFRDLKFEVTMAPLTNPKGEVEAVPYASSSVENWGWALSQSVDTVTNSGPGNYGWVSAIENNATNHTESLVAGLGQLEPVTTVTLFPRNDTGAVGQNFPIDFTIDTSKDGLNWSTQITQTNYPEPTSGAAQTFTLPWGHPSARFVRVTATSLRNEQGGYYFGLAELGIW